MNDNHSAFNFGKNKDYSFLYSVITIVLAVFLVVGVIYAWTEPSATPPGSNVDAPINTGSTPQTKTGDLTVNALTASGGWIVPTAGYGLNWPNDPWGGSGDDAWIKYIQDGSGEDTELQIGINNDANDNIAFYQSGAERMTIYNGRVGIGDLTPDYKLDVAGTIRVQDFTSAGGKNIIVGDDSYLTDIDTANMLGVYGNQNSDRAGIRLGSDGSYIFGDNGNVGIGMVSPGAKLEVAGQIKVTGGSPGANKVLTSDASGLATWQAAAGGIGSCSDCDSRFVNAAGDIMSGILDMSNHKIKNVSEIDPVFGIQGKKYVSYMPDSIGQKVEVVGEARLEGDKLEIDLDNEPEGSDLWLFWQVVDQESVLPFVSPQEDACLYAYIEGSKFVVKLREGVKDAKFSYRLIATRLDHADDTNNFYDDQDVEYFIDIDSLRK